MLRKLIHTNTNEAAGRARLATTRLDELARVRAGLCAGRSGTSSAGIGEQSEVHVPAGTGLHRRGSVPARGARVQLPDRGITDRCGGLPRPHRGQTPPRPLLGCPQPTTLASPLSSSPCTPTPGRPSGRLHRPARGRADDLRALTGASFERWSALRVHPGDPSARIGSSESSRTASSATCSAARAACSAA